MSEENPTSESRSERLDRIARGHKSGLVREYWSFIRHGKKWYQIPIIAALMVLGGLVIAGGSAVAPFLYTLF
jgi:hypothetical protein